MKDIVTIIFGDSITYGIGDYIDNGWVNRLRTKLSNINGHYIFNLGIPGQNSNDILLRCEQEIRNRFNESDDFKLIYAFGIKDALLLNEDQEYLKKFKSNLENIIKISKKYTDDIYFVGLLSVDLKKRQNYQIDNIDKIDHEIKCSCEKLNIKYIRMKDRLSSEDLYDGLHPNEEGHQKICEMIYDSAYKD